MNDYDIGYYVELYCQSAASKMAFARVQKKLLGLWQRKNWRRAEAAERITKMQVLTNGSFINLDNQEKSSALFALPRKLTSPAARTALTTQRKATRFADEIWQGVYVSRTRRSASKGDFR
jgi:hypothetical protein